MKIATWNVNSLRVRLEQLADWLNAEQPDIVALQETKVQDQDFPAQRLHDLGYQVLYAGEKSYNGVALLSRVPGEEFARDLPTFSDPQRRVLGAYFGPLAVLNLYVPNGSAVGSEKYSYKLIWLARLADFVEALVSRHRYLLLLGDFNIAPDDRDVYDPVAWQGQVLVSEPERAALREIQAKGLVDVFREFETAPGCYTWWDYRAGSFRRNHGLRIDHLLATRDLAALCRVCRIDAGPRRWKQPSDHAPVVLELDSPT
jgi:exodeoxyribonuclease-3